MNLNIKTTHPVFTGSCVQLLFLLLHSHDHNLSVCAHIKQTRQQTTWTKPFPSVSSFYAKLGKLGAGYSFMLTSSCHSQQQSEHFPKISNNLWSAIPFFISSCHISRRNFPRFCSERIQYLSSLHCFVIFLLWLLSKTYSIQHDSYCLFLFVIDCMLLNADSFLQIMSSSQISLQIC